MKLTNDSNEKVPMYDEEEHIRAFFLEDYGIFIQKQDNPYFHEQMLEANKRGYFMPAEKQIIDWNELHFVYLRAPKND